VSVERLSQRLDDFGPAEPLDQAGGHGFDQQGMQRGQAAWWFVHRTDTVGPEETLGKLRGGGFDTADLPLRRFVHTGSDVRIIRCRTYDRSAPNAHAGLPASATIQNFPSGFPFVAGLAIRYPETPVVVATVATDPSATAKIGRICAIAVGDFDLPECSASVIVTEPGIGGPCASRDHDAEHQASGGIQRGSHACFPPMLAGGLIAKQSERAVSALARSGLPVRSLVMRRNEAGSDVAGVRLYQSRIRWGILTMLVVSHGPEGGTCQRQRKTALKRRSVALFGPVPGVAVAGTVMSGVTQ
jgi:hypothetical protein